jgi:hypothetical protein
MLWACESMSEHCSVEICSNGTMFHASVVNPVHIKAKLYSEDCQNTSVFAVHWCQHVHRCKVHTHNRFFFLCTRNYGNTMDAPIWIGLWDNILSEWWVLYENWVFRHDRTALLQAFNNPGYK